MKTYRIAILGCRSRGTSAARVYHAHPRTEVVGLCDLVEDRLTTLGDEMRIHRITSPGSGRGRSGQSFVRGLGKGRCCLSKV